MLMLRTFHPPGLNPRMFGIEGSCIPVGICMVGMYPAGILGIRMLAMLGIVGMVGKLGMLGSAGIFGILGICIEGIYPLGMLGIETRRIVQFVGRVGRPAGKGEVIRSPQNSASSSSSGVDVPDPCRSTPDISASSSSSMITVVL